MRCIVGLFAALLVVSTVGTDDIRHADSVYAIPPVYAVDIPPPRDGSSISGEVSLVEGDSPLLVAEMAGGATNGPVAPPKPPPEPEVEVVAYTPPPPPPAPPVTPWLSDAQLYRLRMCESTNNYAIASGNGFYGAYQFVISTWNAVAARNGRADLVGVRPDWASPMDQDWMTRIHWGERGGAPWPVCQWRVGAP